MSFVMPSRDQCWPMEAWVLSFLVLVALALATEGHEHAAAAGSLSPISHPPNRMAPLSDRSRSGVASNLASKLHTPQSPSHSLLDCIQPGEDDSPWEGGLSWAACQKAFHSHHDCSSRVHCYPGWVCNDHFRPPWGLAHVRCIMSWCEGVPVPLSK